MRLSAFRIVKARLARDAFSGAGARLFGGRWNSPGTTMVYTSSSRSLAMLEMLVHLQSQQLLSKYVVFPLEFDDTLATDLPVHALPRGWRRSPASKVMQHLGDHWIHTAASAVLRVPSTVVDSEFHFLLNPAHPDFSQIQIGKKQPLAFDPRLM